MNQSSYFLGLIQYALSELYEKLLIPTALSVFLEIKLGKFVSGTHYLQAMASTLAIVQ